MTIKAQCACGKKFQAKDEYEGRRAICPSCKREFILQAVGIPVFEEVTDLPPPPIKTDGKDDPNQPTANLTPPHSPPFWRDPIIVFGWGMPVWALFAFFGYMAWTHAQPNQPVAQTRDVENPTRSPRSPATVSYKIIDEVIGYGGTRRSVNVALNSKVSERALREIGLEIKATQSAPYSDTLIWYYLSGKGPDEQAWARASFRAGFEDDIAIMGLTIEEEKLLKNLPLSLPSGSEPLGSWLDDKARCRHTIYRTDVGWFLQRVSGNWELQHVIPPTIHEPFVQELQQLTASEGLAFQPRGSSERWLVDSKGLLRMVASDGRVFREPDPIKLRLTAVKD